MKIALASDHAGFEKKQVIKKYFAAEGIEFDDLGSHSDESTDYPDWAHLIANKIEAGEYELGITLCGTGNGINIAANKHAGIRSGLCWNREIGALIRQHNDANICALPARFISDEEAIETVKAFLNSEFEGGRHERRKLKIPLP